MTRNKKRSKAEILDAFAEVHELPMDKAADISNELIIELLLDIRELLEEELDNHRVVIKQRKLLH
jgi:hypothetical protein